MACACDGLVGSATDGEHSETECVRITCACSAKARLSLAARVAVIDAVTHRYTRCSAANGAPLPHPERRAS